MVITTCVPQLVINLSSHHSFISHRSAFGAEVPKLCTGRFTRFGVSECLPQLHVNSPSHHGSRSAKYTALPRAEIAQLDRAGFEPTQIPGDREISGGKTCSSIPRNGKMKNLVLDLGGVIMKWNGGDSNLAEIVDPNLIAHMLQDSVWNEYEKGKLTPAQAYEQLSIKFGVPAKSIESAVECSRTILAPIQEIVDVIEASRGALRLFCMTNIPAAEFEFLREKYPKLWQNFEKVFTSADAGMRKPDLVFFNHVLQNAGIDPKETVFVDDSLQNCVAARSLGMTAIHLKDIDSAVQELFFHLRSEEDRLTAARGYLERLLEDQRQDLITVTHKGARLSDNCVEFLMAEMLEDARFLPMDSAPENGEICYTRDSMETNSWILYPLPTDLDSTSIGLSSLYSLGRVDQQFLISMVEKMLNYVSVDGIPQTYFDHSRPRTDHVVVANITYLFHLAGRRPPAGAVQFLYNVLLNKAYMDGSQYYIHPATFLYFLSKTAAKFGGNHFLPSNFIPLLAARIREQMGVETNHFGVAALVLACLNVGIEPDVRDVERLARMQRPDGSWDVSYMVAGHSHLFGNKALASAFALTALQRVRNLKTNSLGI